MLFNCIAQDFPPISILQPWLENDGYTCLYHQLFCLLLCRGKERAHSPAPGRTSLVTYSWYFFQKCNKNLSLVCSSSMLQHSKKMLGQRQMNLSPYVAHTPVERFRDSGEISVYKGQGGKPLLNVSDLWALRGCLISENVILVLCMYVCMCSVYPHLSLFFRITDFEIGLTVVNYWWP